MKQNLEKWPSIDSWRVHSESAASKPLSALTHSSKLPVTPEIGVQDLSTPGPKSASAQSTSVSISSENLLVSQLGCTIYYWVFVSQFPTIFLLTTSNLLFTFCF